MSSYYGQLLKEENPNRVFSEDFNLLKMDAFSNDFQKCFKYLLRNPVNANR